MRDSRARPVFRYSEMAAQTDALDVEEVPGFQGADADWGEDAPEISEELDEAPARPLPLWARILRGIALIIVAALLVFVGYYSANRWLVYDDASSIVGEWHAVDATAPVTISDTSIRLDDRTTYEYTIDTAAKTITYRFGELEGCSHYRFAPNRHTLVLVDGSDFTFWGTLLDDLLSDARDFYDNATGTGATLPSGDGVIVLKKS